VRSADNERSDKERNMMKKNNNNNNNNKKRDTDSSIFKKFGRASEIERDRRGERELRRQFFQS